MSNEVFPPPFDKIDAALLSVAEALPRLPELHDAVRKLGPATPAWASEETPGDQQLSVRAG